jgi:hypothetical protein
MDREEEGCRRRFGLLLRFCGMVLWCLGEFVWFLVFGFWFFGSFVLQCANRRDSLRSSFPLKIVLPWSVTHDQRDRDSAFLPNHWIWNDFFGLVY